MAWRSRLPGSDVRHAVALAAAAGVLLAHDSRFESQSRLVLVPVTVTDAKGRHVLLQPEEVIVLDNGVRQQVTVDTIDSGIAPVALVIAVQSLGISSPVLE